MYINVMNVGDITCILEQMKEKNILEKEKQIEKICIKIEKV